MALEVNDALEKVREARSSFDAAVENNDPNQRHIGLRLAYHYLSQAASDAYMIFSAKPKTNMFQEGGLSTWAREELGVFTTILGVQYYKQGLVDSVRLECEFDRWVERVRIFINKLSADSSLELGQVAAKDWKEDEIKRNRQRLEDFNRNMMGANGVVEW